MPINARLIVENGEVEEQLDVEVWPHLQHAAVAHVDGHIEDDREADIGDPACFSRRRAMKLAASPISAMESARPNIRIIGCSRAAPATASTLSSDIETSAIVICHTAWPSVF